MMMVCWQLYDIGWKYDPAYSALFGVTRTPHSGALGRVAQILRNIAIAR